MEPEPKPKPKVEPELKPKPRVEPEPKAKAKVEPELKPKPKAEPELKPKPKGEPEPKAERVLKPTPAPKEEPEPKPAVKVEPEAKPEPVKKLTTPPSKGISCLCCCVGLGGFSCRVLGYLCMSLQCFKHRSHSWNFCDLIYFLISSQISYFKFLKRLQNQNQQRFSLNHKYRRSKLQNQKKPKQKSRKQ